MMMSEKLPASSKSARVSWEGAWTSPITGFLEANRDGPPALWEGWLQERLGNKSFRLWRRDLVFCLGNWWAEGSEGPADRRAPRPNSSARTAAVSKQNEPKTAPISPPLWFNGSRGMCGREKNQMQIEDECQDESERPWTAGMRLSCCQHTEGAWAFSLSAIILLSSQDPRSARSVSKQSSRSPPPAVRAGIMPLLSIFYPLSPNLTAVWTVLLHWEEQHSVCLILDWKFETNRTSVKVVSDVV